MNQIVKDEEINLLSNSNLCHKLLGGLVMENCIINIKVSARGLIISQAKFINCTFNFKTKITNYSFTSSCFENCTFLGKMSGCEFGYRKRDNEKIRGNMINCDFSQMLLMDGIRFLDCEMAGIKLPSFPHFTILNPLRNTNFLKDYDSASEKLKKYFDFNREFTWLTEEDKALTKDAVGLSLKYGVKPEELKHILLAFDFIAM